MCQRDHSAVEMEAFKLTCLAILVCSINARSISNEHTPSLKISNDSVQSINSENSVSMPRTTSVLFVKDFNVKGSYRSKTSNGGIRTIKSEVARAISLDTSSENGSKTHNRNGSHLRTLLRTKRNIFKSGGCQTGSCPFKVPGQTLCLPC